MPVPLQVKGLAQLHQLFGSCLHPLGFNDALPKRDSQSQVSAPWIALLFEPISVDEPGSIVFRVGVQRGEKALFLIHDLLSSPSCRMAIC